MCSRLRDGVAVRRSERRRTKAVIARTFAACSETVLPPEGRTTSGGTKVRRTFVERRVGGVLGSHTLPVNCLFAA